MILTFFCLSAALSSIRAQEIKVKLDPANTHVNFTVDSTLHMVHGHFRLKSGAIEFDPATGMAGGEVVVDAASGNSGNESRDKKMKEYVLEADKFPTFTFRPDHVEGKVAPQGISHVQVHGIFNVHGKDREITIPAEVRRNGEAPSVKLQFPVPYVQWGMKNPGNFLLHVDSKVMITIDAVGQQIN